MKKMARRTAQAPEAPKADRFQITATINRRLLEALDQIAQERGWNRSESLDRAIEHFVQAVASDDPRQK